MISHIFISSKFLQTFLFFFLIGAANLIVYVVTRVVTGQKMIRGKKFLKVGKFYVNVNYNTADLIPLKAGKKHFRSMSS